MPANSRYCGRGEKGGGGGGVWGDDSVMFAFDLSCLLFLFPTPCRRLPSFSLAKI